ncbi:MAG: hypothetical protein HYU71_07255 [Bacteroidetes bacterium]|nr:hypothetical protein [Bacteroidota bacterium]
MLFAYGITPKLTLHNLVATHQDGRTRCALPDPFSTQLGTASFNCQCDNLIIESPFVATITALVVVPPVPVYPVFADAFAADVFSSDVLGYSLRGPPAC